MKIKTIGKAQKDQGVCEKCREPIAVGQSYRYIKPRYGAKRKRHASCPIWRQSEMTTAKIATAYAAQEDAHDFLNDLDPKTYFTGELEQDTEGNERHLIDADQLVSDIQEILGTCAQGAEDCKEEYQEGLDNMPEGLQEGPTGEEIQEKIELLEDWGQTLEAWDPQNPEPDGDQDPEEWADEVIDEARQAIDELEL